MIKITSLTRERREGTAKLTFDEQGEIHTEEIRISFLKPTEALWQELVAIENAGGDEKKTTLVTQLLRLEVQSPDIVNEDGTVHQLTNADLLALDVSQLAELWLGVREHFFLQTPAPASETNTSSTSALAAA